MRSIDTFAWRFVLPHDVEVDVPGVGSVVVVVADDVLAEDVVFEVEDDDGVAEVDVEGVGAVSIATSSSSSSSFFILKEDRMRFKCDTKMFGYGDTATVLWLQKVLRNPRFEMILL